MGLLIDPGFHLGFQLWAGGIFCDPSLRGRGAMLDLSARLSPFDLQVSLAGLQPSAENDLLKR